MISLSSSFNFDSASLTSSIIICAEQSYLHQIPYQLCYLQNVHHGQKKKIKADDFFNLSASSNSHDFSLANFEYTRNRLLWATREVPSILAIPRDLKDIHKDGKARGHYKKGIEKEH